MRGPSAGTTAPPQGEHYSLLDELDDRARFLQSVNTSSTDGVLRGYNTDVDGFTESLKLYGIDLKDKKVLILGAAALQRHWL